MGTLNFIYPGAFNQNPDGRNRYITSGELRAGAGTGDAVRSDANFWTGTPQVFGPQTAVQISGLASFGSAGGTRINAAGDVQVSGVLLVYGSAYAGQIGGNSRFITSGELNAGAGTGDATRTAPNYFTAGNTFAATTTFSGLVLHQAAVYQGPTATAAGRYVTSGELTTGSAGGVLNTASVFWTGPAHVFSPNTAVTFSGSLLALAPIHQGAVSASSRYVVSGELRPPGTGTVTAVGVGSNLIASPSTITVTGTLALAPNVSLSTLETAGPVLLNSGLLTLAPLYQATVAAASRYVTSGELRADAGGTVTSLVAGSNLVLQPSPLTTSGSIGLSPDLVLASLRVSGDTLVSGGLLLFSPAFQGTQTGSARYVTSGELKPDTDTGITSLVAGSNVVFQPSPITVTGSIGIAPNLDVSTLTVAGPVLLQSGALAQAPIYQGSVAAAGRYVTSGELRVDAAGTVTSIVPGSNIQIQSNPLTTSGSIGLHPNLAIASMVTTGDTLISGNLLTFSPAYQGAIESAQRYVISGELRVDAGGDFVKDLPNYVTGSPIVFGPATQVTFSGLTAFGSVGGSRFTPTGDLRVSGALTVDGNNLLVRSAGGVFVGTLSFNVWSSINATVTASLGTAQVNSAAGSVRINQGGDIQISGTNVLSYGPLEPPRLTTTQRDALAAPDGSLVYVIGLPVSGMNVRVAGTWLRLATA